VHPGNWGALAGDTDLDVECWWAALTEFDKRNKCSNYNRTHPVVSENHERPPEAAERVGSGQVSGRREPAELSELEKKQQEIEWLKAELHDLRSRSGSRGVFHPRANTS